MFCNDVHLFSIFFKLGHKVGAVQLTCSESVSAGDWPNLERLWTLTKERGTPGLDLSANDKTKLCVNWGRQMQLCWRAICVWQGLPEKPPGDTKATWQHDSCHCRMVSCTTHTQRVPRWIKLLLNESLTILFQENQQWLAESRALMYGNVKQQM